MTFLGAEGAKVSEPDHDRIFISALAEVLDEPFLGLVMDKDVKMADAGFPEAVVERKVSF